MTEIAIETVHSNDFDFHMKRDYRLLFGPMAGVILALGIAGLALMIPGYSHVHQTVSEIGEIGSPARVPSPSCYVALRPASWFSPRPFAMVGRGRPLPIGCISYRVHGVVGCGSRSFRLPVSTSQCFRYFRVDWLPSTACLGARVETRSTSKMSYFPFVDYVRAHMHRHRSESKFARQTGTGLGVRQAYLRLRAKSTLRCYGVRVVCCCERRNNSQANSMRLAFPFFYKETMRTLRNSI